MTKSKKTKIIKDGKGNEFIMLRGDKTLKEIMEEKPQSRWDSYYWHPKFDDILKDINFPIEYLGKFILPDTIGITYGSTKLREWSQPGKGVKYIKSVNVRNTGLDIVEIFWTPEGGSLDGKQYRIKVGDIIMNKSGTGTFGRLFVVSKDYGKMVVSQDTMRIRLNNISPYYVAVYLQTLFGSLQVERFTAGVSGQVHINFDDIKAIKIPIVSNEAQKHIRTEYIKMLEYHNQAMEGKKGSDKNKYKKNIETAEKMLKHLISKTEAVIRGERKDII